MKTTQILDKDGNPLKTKEDLDMYEHVLELGDEFIPTINGVIEKRHTAVIKDKERIITNYSIPCKVRKDGVDYVNDHDNTFFITLTPTQAKSLKTKIESGLELPRNVFMTYKYVNDYGDQIGIGLKRKHIEPISFNDFDKE